MVYRIRYFWNSIPTYQTRAKTYQRPLEWFWCVKSQVCDLGAAECHISVVYDTPPLSENEAERGPV